jgi:hypothetical protein
MVRHAWRVFRRVFIEGDTTTIRVLLAVASLGFTPACGFRCTRSIGSPSPACAR